MLAHEPPTEAGTSAGMRHRVGNNSIVVLRWPRDQYSAAEQLLAAVRAGASAAEIDALLGAIRAEASIRRQLRDDAERVAVLAHRIHLGLVTPSTAIGPLLQHARQALTEACE